MGLQARPVSELETSLCGVGVWVCVVLRSNSAWG